MSVKPVFVIVTQGTKGDIFPFIEIAKELLKRNYKVIIVTNSYFRSMVEKEGVGFYSSGTIEEYERGVLNYDAWDPSLISNNIPFKEYHKPAYIRSLNYLKELYLIEKNIILISVSFSTGAKAIADSLGIPTIIVTLSPNMIPSLTWIQRRSYYPRYIPEFFQKLHLKFMIKRQEKESFNSGIEFEINQIRREYNLPILKNFNAKEYRNEVLRIALFPNWFGMKQKDWPNHIYQVGFPKFEDVNLDARDKVDAFLKKKQKPIIFTFGTGVKDTSVLFLECLKSCEELNIPAIFVGGSGGKINNDRYLFIDYVDFSYTLPKCLMIVHHGGIGTISQAINAKIPQIIRPMLYDQPDNAYRLEVLGLGVKIDCNEFYKERIIETIKYVLSSSFTKKFNRNFLNKIDNSNSIKASVDIIEKNMQKLLET